MTYRGPWPTLIGLAWQNWRRFELPRIGEHFHERILVVISRHSGGAHLVASISAPTSQICGPHVAPKGLGVTVIAKQRILKARFGWEHLIVNHVFEGLRILIFD